MILPPVYVVRIPYGIYPMNPSMVSIGIKYVATNFVGFFLVEVEGSFFLPMNGFANKM